MWKVSESLGHCEAYNPNRISLLSKQMKHSFLATNTKRNGLRIMFRKTALWQNRELKMHRQHLSRSMKKQEMLKMWD